ncbi:Fur family transcriptional regulator [Candidatus Margulisiibacteriota bacterium]
MPLVTYEQIFSHFLSEHNYAYSDNRKIILNEVFSIHHHFEIHTFIDSLKKKYASISRATIYRTFSLLMDAGLIRKFTDVTGKTYYEHVYGHQHHDHMICTSCGSVIEIHDPKLESAKKKTCEQNGFSPKHHTLQIYGVCKNCS